jgi:monoamine oxidase
MIRPGLLGVLVLGVACGKGPDPLPDDTDVDTTPAGPPPIIVVGAGVAGLTTARLLQDAGKDVVVLEARDRLGGRVWSTSVGSTDVDLGAAWVHGNTAENPVRAAFDTMGTAVTDDDQGKLGVWDEGFGWLERADVAPIVVGAIDFARQAEEIRLGVGAGASVATGIDWWLDSRPAVPDDARRRTRFFSKWFAEDRYGGTADAQSLDWFFKDQAFPGRKAVPAGGFGALIDALADGLDVRTGEVVTDIAYDADGVVVTSSSGDLAGTDVIVTVPLGVLKAGAIGFEPPLPSDKAGAIDRLGVGTYEKVVLVFPNDFWTTQGHELYHLVAGRGSFPYFVDLSRFTGTPALCFLSPADAGDRVSAFDDADAVDAAMVTLREMFGDAIPEPVDTAVTSWHGDPFARGSGSFLEVGSSPSDMAAIAAPVGEHLRFAGEHTIYEYHGTVHGGMLSGFREAGAILGTTITAIDLSN